MTRRTAVGVAVLVAALLSGAPESAVFASRAGAKRAGRGRASEHDRTASLHDERARPPALVVLDRPLERRRRVRHARRLRLPTAIVENVARIDGAVVVRPTGELIAVGAILMGVGGMSGIEGVRTTAAIHASHLGTAIKVSEDGVVSLFKDGTPVWHL